MNFRRGGVRPDEPEISFIPLIDLLLVVLIFLMVTTTYARHGELELDLPGASTQAKPQRADELVVAVTREGRYAIAQSPAAARTSSALAAELAAAARGRNQPLVVVHADAGASHQSVVAVLEAARAAGLARVSFATQQTH